MTIPPKFAGQKLLATASQQPQHTLELFLDYVCPFSAKQFSTFYASARPIIAQKYSSKLQVIFRQQVQPWHPSSTLAHEAAVAVLRIAPEKFWQFSSDLFKHQEEFFDANVVNETRNKTYERLAKIAGGAGIDENEVLKLLIVKDHADENGQLNAGNQVTNDLKLIIRLNRVIGVHVSPTVYFDGLEQPGISSSFDAGQWEEWLAKNVT